MDFNLVLQMSLYSQDTAQSIVYQNDTQGQCCEINFANLTDQVTPQRRLSVSSCTFLRGFFYLSNCHCL